MEYVYELIDDNEGVIGIFTSEQEAVEAAVNDGWVESESDFYEDLHNSHMYIEIVPLNEIWY